MAAILSFVPFRRASTVVLAQFCNVKVGVVS